MASRNFHKRRTKDRKARQRAERLDAEQSEFRRSLHRFRSMPVVLDGTGYSAALAALGHAPKMFVRDGKRVPFEYL